MNITNTQLLGIIAALGVIGTCWSKIRELLSVFFRIFVVSVEAEDYTLYHAICMVLWEDFKIVSFRSYSYDGWHVFRPSIRKRQFTAFETLSKNMVVFRKGWKPIIVSWTPEKGGGDAPRAYGHGMSFSFIRGTFDADEIIQEAVNRYNNRFCNSESTGDRFFVTYCYGELGRQPKRHSEDDDGPPSAHGGDDFEKYYSMRPVGAERTDIGYRKSSQWKEIYILDEELEQAREEARFWLAHRDWYMERGIPWKRGWMLTGKPGVGKTSFVRWLGRQLDLPIFIFDLGTFANQDFIDKWKEVGSKTPCIVLFEDIDSIFHGRENTNSTAMQRALTFDCLLNAIDGVQESNGIFIILTANDISHLAKAIGVPDNARGGVSTRPGRVDRIIELQPFCSLRRRKLAEIIMSDFPGEIDRIVAASDGEETGAQFANRCCVEAERLYWKKEHETCVPNSETVSKA